jgi:hypothetical protein
LRVRIGSRGLLRVVGVVFLVGAAGVYALTLKGPPPLESMERNRGIVGDVKRHTSTKSAPYITMSIGGLTYVVRSYRKAWMDSLHSALQRGDTATVWGVEVPNGWYQVWQLQKGDSMVIRYADRVSRERASDASTRVLAEVVGGLALLMIGASAFIPKV